MKIETDKLMTPKNFAVKSKVSRQLIYKKIADDKLVIVKIDGVIFVVLKQIPHKASVPG